MAVVASDEVMDLRVMKRLLKEFEIVAKCRAQNEHRYLHYDQRMRLDAPGAKFFCARGTGATSTYFAGPENAASRLTAFGNYDR
jgi:hypothetical protein